MNPHHHNLTPMPEGWTGDRMRVLLVYQAGIANVFRVDCFNLGPYGRNAVRLYQGDFRGAEMIAHGMGLAGAVVRSVACNMAGDIAGATWSDDLEAQPFSESFRPVFFCTIGPSAKTFRVFAVSANANSFGLHGHVLIARDGEGWEVAKSKTPPVWVKGQDIKVQLDENGAPQWALLSCEIPRKLPKAPAKVLKELYAEEEPS